MECYQPVGQWVSTGPRGRGPRFENATSLNELDAFSKPRRTISSSSQLQKIAGSN